MVSWSCLGRSCGIILLRNSSNANQIQQNVKFSVAQALRGGGHGPKTMAIQPSRWQWHKFKDMLHYYLMVGLIPVTAIILYSNIFIGPATLRPIPEGYVPKHWEYHQHPITRFISRYIHKTPQQDYEKFCHWVDEEGQKQKLVLLEKEIKQKMAERLDYKAFYYRPLVNKYLRNEKVIADEVYNRLGEIIDD